ncbi:MAG: PD-(D/E)XK nuclease family protein [Anaerolineales bacterium]|jgi:ATP-dependent helicase/DNAse subunit B
MTVTLLVAPSASGKTEFCLEQARKTLERHPLQSAWFLVPDRVQTAAIRRRLAVGGGAMASHVGTFDDLYRHLLLRAGRPVPVCSDSMIHRLVEGAVQDLAGRGELTYYGAIARLPGFTNALCSRIAELKQARVLPATFLRVAKNYGPALVELAKVQAAYQERLQEVGWIDPEGLNRLALEALEQDSRLAAEIRLLVVDGFDSFNRAQLAVMGRLGETVPEFIVTLPGEQRAQRTASRRFVRSLAGLRSAFPKAVLEGEGLASGLPGSLGHLERGLFEPGMSPQASDGSVSFVEARTAIDEAREALRWIKARIVRDDLRPDECALITPDPERYRPHLLEAGEEFGIPLRFTHGDALASAPGVAALLDLLELPPRGWPRQLTVDAVRAPYFDLSPFHLAAQDAEPLELASLFGPVIAGLPEWEDTLGRLALRSGPALDEEGELIPSPLLPTGAQAASLWQGLDSLSRRLEPPGGQPTRAWVEWLEDLLEEVRFFDCQETERDKAVALNLRETLRALVLAERVTGEIPAAFQEFLGVLRSTLEGTFSQDPLPWGCPAALVLRVLEARGLRYRAVALLGLSEGLFPEMEREDPFLREAVRAQLDLEPRLEREQAGLFYQAVTRADQFLLLTRPTLADDGERWEPSPYWTAAISLFTDSPTLIRPNDPRPIDDAASAEEVLFLAVRRGSLPKSFGDLAPRLDRLRRARSVLRARLSRGPESPFEGDLSSVRESLGKSFGPDHVWSPTRLESYGSCPYQFFTVNVLGLEAKEPPEIGLDVQKRGTLLHAILERAYRQARDARDPESVISTLQEAAEAEFRAAPEKLGFRPWPLWDAEQAYLIERLTETVRGLAALEGGWTPMEFERSFGREGAPALELRVDSEIVLLRGIIDRVDVNRTGQLRILDYKSGSTHLSPRDLIEGRRLQLPIYALAAREALKLGQPVEGLYWAILAARAGSLRLSRFKYGVDPGAYQGPEGAARLAGQHIRRIVAKVRGGKFAPEPPPGGCPSYCPATAWCWRFAPAEW